MLRWPIILTNLSDPICSVFSVLTPSDSIRSFPLQSNPFLWPNLSNVPSLSYSIRSYSDSLPFDHFRSDPFLFVLIRPIISARIWSALFRPIPIRFAPTLSVQFSALRSVPTLSVRIRCDTIRTVKFRFYRDQWSAIPWSMIGYTVINDRLYRD